MYGVYALMEWLKGDSNQQPQQSSKFKSKTMQVRQNRLCAIDLGPLLDEICMRLEILEDKE